MDPLKNLIYDVMASDFGLENSWISVMCRASRFQITVSLKDLRGSRFEQEYSQLVDKFDDMDAGADDDYEALCAWVIEPCFSYIREHTKHVPKDLTFEAYYFPPTHHLKVMVSKSSLDAKATRDRHTINPSVLMIPSRDLPPCPEVRRSKASDIQIVPVVTDTDDYLSEIPRKAITGDGTIKFFKPALDFEKSQIIREIDMHSRILNAGLTGKIRVPNFHSIVISNDAKLTLGLLFDFIPSGGESLRSPRYKAAKEYHAKWKQQVSAMVQELHSHDIVWGDVHPGNIVIDENFDAWIVDFGGGHIEEFVNRKKAGTKEGDWQGVRNIFDNWMCR